MTRILSCFGYIQHAICSGNVGKLLSNDRQLTAYNMCHESSESSTFLAPSRTVFFSPQHKCNYFTEFLLLQGWIQKIQFFIPNSSLLRYTAMEFKWITHLNLTTLELLIKEVIHILRLELPLRRKERSGEAKRDAESFVLRRPHAMLPLGCRRLFDQKPAVPAPIIIMVHRCGARAKRRYTAHLSKPTPIDRLATILRTRVVLLARVDDVAKHAENASPSIKTHILSSLT